MRRTQYFKWGLTAFLTVCAVLVFYDTFYQAGTLQQFVSRLASILAPVLYGFAIAYLLTPIMSWLEKAIRALWRRATKKELKPRSGALPRRATRPQTAVYPQAFPPVQRSKASRPLCSAPACPFVGNRHRPTY